jgi:hypothetical protein
VQRTSRGCLGFGLVGAPLDVVLPVLLGLLEFVEHLAELRVGVVELVLRALQRLLPVVDRRSSAGDVVPLLQERMEHAFVVERRRRDRESRLARGVELFLRQRERVGRWDLVVGDFHLAVATRADRAAVLADTERRIGIGVDQDEAGAARERRYFTAVRTRRSAPGGRGVPRRR